MKVMIAVIVFCLVGIGLACEPKPVPEKPLCVKATPTPRVIYRDKIVTKTVYVPAPPPQQDRGQNQSVNVNVYNNIDVPQQPPAFEDRRPVAPFQEEYPRYSYPPALQPYPPPSYGGDESLQIFRGFLNAIGNLAGARQNGYRGEWLQFPPYLSDGGIRPHHPKYFQGPVDCGPIFNGGSRHQGDWFPSHQGGGGHHGGGGGGRHYR